jgi:hypothetical protein
MTSPLYFYLMNLAQSSLHINTKDEYSLFAGICPLHPKDLYCLTMRTAAVPIALPSSGSPEGRWGQCNHVASTIQTDRQTDVAVYRLKHFCSRQVLPIAPTSSSKLQVLMHAPDITGKTHVCYRKQGPLTNSGLTP